MLLVCSQCRVRFKKNLNDLQLKSSEYHTILSNEKYFTTAMINKTLFTWYTHVNILCTCVCVNYKYTCYIKDDKYIIVYSL